MGCLKCQNAFKTASFCGILAFILTFSVVPKCACHFGYFLYESTLSAKDFAISAINLVTALCCSGRKP